MNRYLLIDKDGTPTLLNKEPNLDDYPCSTVYRVTSCANFKSWHVELPRVEVEKLGIDGYEHVINGAEE